MPKISEIQEAIGSQFEVTEIDRTAIAIRDRTDSNHVVRHFTDADKAMTIDEYKATVLDLAMKRLTDFAKHKASR